MRISLTMNELYVLKNLSDFVSESCEHCPCYNSSLCDGELCILQSIMNKVTNAEIEQREIYLYQMNIDDETKYALIEPAKDFISYYDKNSYETLKEKLIYLLDNKDTHLPDVENVNFVEESAIYNNQTLEDRFMFEYEDIRDLYGTMILRIDEIFEVRNEKDWNETSVKLLLRKDQWIKFNLKGD